MRSYRNNNKRPRFRSNGDRSFKRNGESQTFSVNSNFQRKLPGKNNHNAPKLIEKYNDLAREALSNGDKILSENYFQHADHFTRVINERESIRREKFAEYKSEENTNLLDETKTQNEKIPKSNVANVSNKESEEDKVPEPQV